MTSLLDAPHVAGLSGSQVPRVCTGPAFSSSAGDEAIELAAHAGLHLDPWQQFVLRQSLGEGAGGKWAAFETGLLVPRQNGKGSILEARELAGLFLFGEELILHSAHLYRTSVEAYRRITRLIKNTPDLHKRVLRYPAAHGDEGVELKNGARLMFVARTKGSGRGFSGDCIILDEAYNLDDGAITAMMPTMAARPNPQIWYTSSAGDHTSTVLGRVVRRGLAGDPSLAFMDWSVEHDPFDERANASVDADDRGNWAGSNPGLGIRVTEDYIEKERRSLGRDGFVRERLGVASYPLEEDQDRPIPDEIWDACEDSSSKREGSVSFAIDMTLDRSRTSIVAAAARSDGKQHLEVVENRPGVDWIVGRVKGIRDSWNPSAIVIDPGGPAGSLIPDLVNDVDLTLMTTREVAQASGSFVNAVRNGEIRHLGDQRLTNAVRGARTRPLSDTWAFDRDTPADSSPLLAAVLARHGFMTTAGDVDIYFLE